MLGHWPGSLRGLEAGLFKFLFLVFLIVPIIEIFVLIEVGSVIGALATIALVVATAGIGAALIRAQGFATLARLQRELASGEMPALTLLEGVFILVAGALLLTPGFVTDIVGFCFLTPPLRRSMAGSIAGQLPRTGGGFARTWRPALSVSGCDGLRATAVAGNVMLPFTNLKLSMSGRNTVSRDRITDQLPGCPKKTYFQSIKIAHTIA